MVVGSFDELAGFEAGACADEGYEVGCGRNDHGLVFLARWWAKRHPADAIPILLREAKLAIDRRSSDDGFAQAANLLTVLEEVHQQASREFADCLERFEAAFDHRRPLLSALANAGL